MLFSNVMVDRYYDKPHNADAPNPFRCQGYLRGGGLSCRGGGEVPIEDLPPFLRALLVTDGTVTKLLEAYFWELVEVQTVRQGFVMAERAIEWLDLGAGDEVLTRQARLRGAETEVEYATAFSVICASYIPLAFRRRLIDREIGIGALIRDSGLESYREVLEVGVERVAASRGQDADVVFRTYRIIIGGRPVILITESFPLGVYR